MSYRDSTPDEEAEATQFAMELLMPEEFVREELAKFSPFNLLNPDHMKKLSNKFKVPEVAMALRLGQIKLQKPV